MQFFKTCFSVKAIKTLYRELAKKYHPDLGGDTATMQQVNDQYHEALKGKQKSVSTDPETGKEYTYYYSQKIEQTLMDKLRELLGMMLPEDVIIELVGIWIWVYGNTKPHRDKLGKNGAKCLWHSKRKKWYFRTGKNRAYYSGASFDTLRAAYGSNTDFKTDDQVA
jgi:hypothetical protein